MTLELKNVGKTYDGGQTFAVEDVSFSAGRGDLVVLVGESGCGKTTTLKTINRLVEPTSGQVLIDGSDIAKRNAVELRRSIGYVFQGIGLFPHLSIARNVGIIPKLLELVRLDPEEYGSRNPAELSGGQRQRVGFARALSAGPSLMLLDEPGLVGHSWDTCPQSSPTRTANFRQRGEAQSLLIEVFTLLFSVEYYWFILLKLGYLQDF